MDKNEIIQSGLLEEYVLGLISPQQKEQVEAMMEKHAEIAQTVEEMQGAMQSYCKSIVKPPPPGLKEKILKNLGTMSKAPKTPSLPVFYNANRSLWAKIGPLSAAASVVFILLSAFLFIKNQDLQNDMITYREVLEKSRQENSQMITEMAMVQDQASFLQDIRTAHVHLTGTDKAPQATAVAYWNDKNQKVYLNIIDLPSPPDNMTYQLWADVQGKMINMGILNNIRSSWIQLPYIPQAESLNVTLEKEGGSPSPNTEQIFIRGTISL
jgi:anti-sigma-K factor RskA